MVMSFLLIEKDWNVILIFYLDFNRDEMWEMKIKFWENVLFVEGFFMSSLVIYCEFFCFRYSFFGGFLGYLYCFVKI